MSSDIDSDIQKKVEDQSFHNSIRNFSNHFETRETDEGDYEAVPEKSHTKFYTDMSIQAEMGVL